MYNRSLYELLKIVELNISTGNYTPFNKMESTKLRDHYKYAFDKNINLPDFISNNLRQSHPYGIFDKLKAYKSDILGAGLGVAGMAGLGFIGNFVGNIPYGCDCLKLF
jgi:hypothetical protein